MGIDWRPIQWKVFPCHDIIMRYEANNILGVLFFSWDVLFLLIIYKICQVKHSYFTLVQPYWYWYKKEFECRSTWEEVTIHYLNQWASCQIQKIAGAHAPGMPGTFSPPLDASDPDMHHGTCVTHVPWCMPWSLTSGFLWSRRRVKTFPAFPAHAQPAMLRIW